MAIGIIRNLRGGNSQVKNIFENGKLASGLTLSGQLTQSGQTLQMVRNGNGNGGYICNVDLTKIATISVDFQGNTAFRMQVLIDNTTIIVDDSSSARRSITFTVGNLTGVKDIRFTSYDNNVTATIYGITCTPMPKFTDNDVVKNAIINSNYAYDGMLYPKAEYLSVQRSGSDASANNGGYIRNIDMTNAHFLYIDCQNINSSYPLQINVEGVTASQQLSGTNRQVISFDVSGVTGLAYVRFRIGVGSGENKVFNVTLEE